MNYLKLYTIYIYIYIIYKIHSFIIILLFPISKDKAYQAYHCLHESVHLPVLTPHLPNPVLEQHK